MKPYTTFLLLLIGSAFTCEAHPSTPPLAPLAPYAPLAPLPPLPPTPPTPPFPPMPPPSPPPSPPPPPPPSPPPPPPPPASREQPTTQQPAMQGGYGKCISIAPEMIARSHWCSKGELYGGPSHGSNNFGRQTIYSASTDHKGWCGVPLGNAPSDAVPVAVSTKYIGLNAQSPMSPACDRCVCITIAGADRTSNPNAPAAYFQYVGRRIKGKVMDQCPECEDEHVDILDTPLYNGVVPRDIAYGVGVWTIEWNWIDCSAKC